jgi:wyosine [tRNA(Phe)-imidazoG37] synthetase (radical SAM superfamily)
MPTFLFDQIIFGPVKSRRLGVSLGINLLPTNTKLCTFDCIYCECGWTPKSYKKKVLVPSRVVVAQHLEETLIRMATENQYPDVITFAGNGEPTIHPEFAGIVEDTISLREKLAPKARIAVLSNSSLIHKKEVFDALLLVDDNILKLDSALETTVKLLDCPSSTFNLQKTIEQLVKFNGKVTIQTMFLRGCYKGQNFDNTAEDEVAAWIELLKKIHPLQVMIYTIDRDTPAIGLEKIGTNQLEDIASKVRREGIAVQVS